MSKKDNHENKPTLTDSDNPSLCSIDGNIRLRVHEDFFCETELPKWKKFKEAKEALFRDLNAGSIHEAASKIKSIKKEDPEKAKMLQTQLEHLELLEKILEDDRWDIKGKHEREVDAALEKHALFLKIQPKAVKGRIARLFSRGPKLIPVDVAFKDLKEHMILTSTAELSKAKVLMDQLAQRYATTGQYAKAAKVKEYMVQVVEELALAESGFTKYVTEEQMIEFVKKSERGVMVNFLRYYEGDIPDDVLKKKQEADDKLIFDNYVVAYFSDIVKQATAVKEKKEQKVREKRRDPILFGIIKQSRKLYYIADWVTPDDDLTLDLLQKVLGKKAFELQNVFGKKTAKSLNVERDDPSVGLQIDLQHRASIPTSVAQSSVYSNTLSRPYNTNTYLSYDYDSPDPIVWS